MQKFIKKLRPIFFEDSKFPVILSKFVPIDVWAISIGPFVWCRGKLSPQTRRHEAIHFFQQLEMLFIFQWICYGSSYLYNRVIRRMDGPLAYRMNAFELEAYNNEADETYLDTRKPYAWLDYTRISRDET